MKKHDIHRVEIEKLQVQLSSLAEMMSVKRSQLDIARASINFHSINASIWEYKLKEIYYDIWVEEKVNNKGKKQ